MPSLSEKLSSRDVLADLVLALEQSTGAGWVGMVAGSTPIRSMKEEEIFRWLGQVPGMRKWVGGRLAKGLSDQSYTLRKELYESTLEVLVDELRRDRFGQVRMRINELAARTASHWASLLTTLIINGESATCYDGQYFFDTDHSEGSSGSQSNDISVDISALAVSNHGSTTAPSVGEMRETILQAVQKILSFKDDQGEPMNENAASFLVKVPVPLWATARAAVALPMVDSGEANMIPAMGDLSIQVAANARLTWTDKIAVFRTDSQVPALIRLEDDDGLSIDAIAEGSELEFRERKHNYGVSGYRTVGYGYWQYACLATMV